MSQPFPESISPSAFKYRLPVTLFVAGGPPVAGWVSLLRHSEVTRGPQTLLARLNSRVRVLPVAHSRVTHLVNRSLIEWAQAAPGVEPRLIGPAEFMVARDERARIRMRSGRVLEGIIAMEVPVTRNRISDFINGDEDFFALCCSTGMLLVNKRRVRDVRLETNGASAAA